MQSVSATVLAVLLAVALVSFGLGMNPDQRGDGSTMPKRERVIGNSPAAYAFAAQQAWRISREEADVPLGAAEATPTAVIEEKADMALAVAEAAPTATIEAKTAAEADAAAEPTAVAEAKKATEAKNGAETEAAVEAKEAVAAAPADIGSNICLVDLNGFYALAECLQGGSFLHTGLMYRPQAWDDAKDKATYTKQCVRDKCATTCSSSESEAATCLEKCSGPEADIPRCADAFDHHAACGVSLCSDGRVPSESLECALYRCGTAEMFPNFLPLLEQRIKEINDNLKIPKPSEINLKETNDKLKILKACQQEECAEGTEGDFNSCMCQKCELAEQFPEWGKMACTVPPNAAAA